jgi:aldose 1-epimerase
MESGLVNHLVSLLSNDFWQVGILPGTGASIAFAQVKHGDDWVDLLRPTAESDYGNSSDCSSFIMLPWCNRIKAGLLRFQGKEYQLRTTKDDGTARHGDTRGRPWRIDEHDEAHIRMSIRSDDYPDMNWPFRFSAWAEYMLDGRDFVWTLTLKNEDTRLMPGGFGYHPYFVRSKDVQVQIPCDLYFQLTDYMATGAAVPINAELDYRQMRPVPETEVNDLLTGRQGSEPAHIRFPQQEIEVAMHSDALFEHFLIFTPKGKPFFAVEPMTNASDGFNLHERGITGSGVFVLQAGEDKSAAVRLVVVAK